MLAVVLLCVVSALFWLWSQYRVKPDEPPLLPGAWPILGHLPSLIGDKCTFWYKCNEFADCSYERGGVIRFKIGPRTLYVVTDPDEMLIIANACLEKSSEYDFINSWFGEGLLTAKALKWKEHRKLISPAFNQNILDTFIGIFNKESRKLVKAMEKEVGKGLFNHSAYIEINTLETICSTVLGVNISDPVMMKEYIQTFKMYLHSLMERIVKFWWFSPYTFRFSRMKKTQDHYVKILNNMSDRVFESKIAEMNKNINIRNSGSETKFKPLVELLLELSQNGVLNNTEVREHINTIMGAAFDTTDAVLLFTLFLLGSYPEVQEKAYIEIKDVLGNEDRDIEKQDLSKLVYLEAVIKESMRFHTPVPMVARQIVRNIKLKNCTLYAGNTCLFFQFAVNRHPIWGPDKCLFRPERWLDPSQLLNLNKTYASFGSGRRSCIGKVFAMMSMKATVAHLIRHYRITSENTMLRLKLDITLKAESGYFIKIEKRMQSQ